MYIKTKEEFELFKTILNEQIKDIKFILDLINYTYSRNDELYDFINNMQFSNTFSEQNSVCKLFEKLNYSKNKKNPTLITFQENKEEKIKTAKKELENILTSF